MAINLAPLQTAARDLDDTALAAWADALEEQGDEEGATTLRAMPALLEAIRGAVTALRAWCTLLSHVQVYILREGSWYSPIIRLPIDDPYWGKSRGASDALRVLLVRWDELHPAVEWLARRLEMPVVQMAYGKVGGAKNGEARRRREWGPFSLRRQHLRPIPGATIDRCILRQAWR
jgi:hypothetical protein